MVHPRFFSSQPQQVDRTHTAGRLVVYLMFGCSATLLLKSFQLETHRIENLVLSSVSTTSRVLPEEYSAVSQIGGTEHSEFFVPSLDYRVKGISQYDNEGRDMFEAHVYCQDFEKDLLWEWWKPDDRLTEEAEEQRLLRYKGFGSAANTPTSRKRLLIGVSSGYDNRAKLLERSVWSARIYGTLLSGEKSDDNLHDVDVTVVTLQGTAFSPHGCKAPPSHSSIDKIRILFEAIDSESQYDRLLLLDTDAMMYDMDTDLVSLGDGNNDFVVIGSPILTENGKRDKNRPWEISSGITIWNLENPQTRVLALDWFTYAKNAIIRGSYQSDQKYLHKALKQYYSTNPEGIVKRDEDRDISIIQVLEDEKQFGIRMTTAKENKSSNIEETLVQMEETAVQICDRYPDACKKVGATPKYETS